MKKIALLLLAILSLAGCAGGADEEPAAATPSACVRDGLLELRLSANPSTGYSWSFTHEGDGRLSFREREHRSSDESGLLTGSGGTDVFLFAPESSGEGRLCFSYARTWEDKPPAETWEVDFAVLESGDGLIVELR